MIIVSLLIIAVILSTTSIVMNVSTTKEISQAKLVPIPTGDVSIEILPTPANTGGPNELG